MQKKLTKLQAYNAMVQLLKHYYYLDSSGDIGIIIGCMSFLQDKKTVDDAMWFRWGEALDMLLQGNHIKNYNHITVWQAFVAMGIFLEEYFGTEHLAKDIAFLHSNTMIARKKKKVDLELWKIWLQYVDYVLTVKDSREYFKLLSKKADYTPNNRP